MWLYTAVPDISNTCGAATIDNIATYTQSYSISMLLRTILKHNRNNITWIYIVIEASVHVQELFNDNIKSDPQTKLINNSKLGSPSCLMDAAR